MAAILRKKQKTAPEEEMMACWARARIIVRKLLLTAFVVALGATAFDHARAAYPDRPITIIVCFPPGGGADLAARGIL